MDGAEAQAWFPLTSGYSPRLGSVLAASHDAGPGASVTCCVPGNSGPATAQVGVQAEQT